MREIEQIALRVAKTGVVQESVQEGHQREARKMMVGIWRICLTSIERKSRESS